MQEKTTKTNEKTFVDDILQDLQAKLAIATATNDKNELNIQKQLINEIFIKIFEIEESKEDRRLEIEALYAVAYTLSGDIIKKSFEKNDINLVFDYAFYAMQNRDYAVAEKLFFGLKNNPKHKEYENILNTYLAYLCLLKGDLELATTLMQELLTSMRLNHNSSIRVEFNGDDFDILAAEWPSVPTNIFLEIKYYPLFAAQKSVKQFEERVLDYYLANTNNLIDEQIALVRNYIENRRYEHVIYTANKILLCKSRYSSQDVAIINHLIDAYYFMNDYQEQEHWLTIILTLTKSEYLAYYQEKLLMVYIMSGKMKTAAEYFNELVKNNQATQSFQEYLLIAQQNQNSKESSITAEDNTKRLLACLADIFKRFPN